MDILQLNSFISLEEAEFLLSSLFLSSDERREEWDTLSDEDKKVLLNKGYINISTSNIVIPKQINNDFKMAQLYEALAFLGDTDTYDAKINGIQSETSGKITVSYFKNTNSSLNNIISNEARMLLKKYVNRFKTVR